MSSSSNRPDLDWSQVRETVRILQASAIHIELAMSGGDESISKLVASFSTVAEMTEQIEHTFELLRQGAPAALTATDEIHTTAENLEQMRTQSMIAIEAFQFYDRLWQKLNYLISGLEETSQLIADSRRLYNPEEWSALHAQLRESMNMEEDRALFDAIISGKNRAEAIEIAMREKQSHQNAKVEDDDIDFF